MNPVWSTHGLLKTAEGRHDLEDRQVKFRKLMLEAMDEGLLVIGEKGRQAIYIHLEVRKGLKKQESPDKVEEFSRALHEIFGNGSYVIEKIILRHLYLSLGLEFREKQGTSFNDYVIDAKKSVGAFGLSGIHGALHCGYY
jgi:hypothetical protein